MSEEILKIKLLKNDAKIPTKNTEEAAGWDLYSPDNYNIKSHSGCPIFIGIAIGVPKSYYGRIAPRSGLAFRNCIDVLGGVVDSDYTGEICAILFNNSDECVEIKKGDRVAQLILEKYASGAKIEIVEELLDTERGENGFGSSGK